MFEKLTIRQKDQIRERVSYHKLSKQKKVRYNGFSLNFAQVHKIFLECIEKEDGAHYPTTTAVHEAVQQIPGMPKWCRATSYQILRCLGFE